MNVEKIKLMTKVFALLLCTLMSPAASVQESIPLTKSRVLGYMKAEIASVKLQNNMKADTQQYKDIIRDFYRH